MIVTLLGATCGRNIAAKLGINREYGVGTSTMDLGMIGAQPML